MFERLRSGLGSGRLSESLPLNDVSAATNTRDPGESIRRPFQDDQAAQELLMTFGNQPQQLGRTIAPYMGEIVILSLVTLGALFVSIQRDVWGLILSVLVVGWPLFGVLVYIGRKYRIYWTEDDVRQRAGGGAGDRITAMLSS